jgi:hypothetical protein
MSSGQGYTLTEVIATTTMSPGELEAHFAPQLEAAGWTRIAGRTDGPVAWSLWRTPGEEAWQGSFLAMEAPGEQRRRLSLRLESPEAGTPTFFGSGASTTLVAPR